MVSAWQTESVRQKALPMQSDDPAGGFLTEFDAGPDYSLIFAIDKYR